MWDATWDGGMMEWRKKPLLCCVVHSVSSRFVRSLSGSSSCSSEYVNSCTIKVKIRVKFKKYRQFDKVVTKLYI
uniref:Uncharacterized protein n=1 Tax=Oryza brachyantha TaxID=4533 RepID=J3L783_ORYBR